MKYKWEQRRFASNIGQRVVLPITSQCQIELLRGITVITSGGSEHVIRTLDASSTYRDVYVEIRRVLGLPLRQTPISVYVFLMKAGKNCSLGENAELPCSSRMHALSDLKGSTLQAVVHR
jgi:hypothetical protein